MRVIDLDEGWAKKPRHKPLDKHPLKRVKNDLRQVAQKTYCRSSRRPTVGHIDDLPWVPKSVFPRARLKGAILASKYPPYTPSNEDE